MSSSLMGERDRRALRYPLSACVGMDLMAVVPLRDWSDLLRGPLEEGAGIGPSTTHVSQSPVVALCPHWDF